ncbi:Uncharacterised protein [Legionella beliardensis]|uniref:Uncharacterized protein n=1 Tax=Legionella beliardensis TaxID=91822 RepID=A0A378I341_9GAMM|nr:hypothetical protein [Legionella beliardensis]STX29170.1 Uncharacterised protein [Legionella beliardensis]
MRGYDGHVVGLTTHCQSIHLHGAMAGNITNKFTEDLAASLRQSDLPRNGNDQNIMPCVVSKLFSFFSARLDQPQRVAFNVNTCLLRRGDLRDGPTEFEQFLDRAGLNKEERETFIEFLLDERATDETGAGVSFDNLEQYIKQSGLSDKIAIVSSCSIIAMNNLTSLGLLHNP